MEEEIQHKTLFPEPQDEQGKRKDLLKGKEEVIIPAMAKLLTAFVLASPSAQKETHHESTP